MFAGSTTLPPNRLPTSVELDDFATSVANSSGARIKLQKARWRSNKSVPH